ncbi:uncharacterized protein CMU_017100 [Cryptosporidium muris RN66]|uniref:SET domain-containing protein n=1 Tax=Cryptosporidium muris (strain RN66) TaxID=441375 RepID=B6ACV4_CRYMR|nr:uncharacterized protein CMU_017100 [Cryptosporidium muris RN66]EEA05958.1 hypothetical protein, conserved [Cryptosporidium muris RN66]|eukprot:XP_002140307.1 hypothetical protein [Cryptosporidium muris RN66]
MDLIIDIPIEIDASESLVENRRRLLQRWNLQGPRVILCIKDEVFSRDNILNSTCIYFHRTANLIKSFYVASLTEQDIYLAMAFDIDEVNEMNLKDDIPQDVHSLKYYSEQSLNLPLMNPVIMRRILIQLSHILRNELNNVATGDTLELAFENYRLLVNTCLKVVTTSLEFLCRQSIETIQDEFFIDSNIIDEMKLSFSTRDDTLNQCIVTNNIGISVHPKYGKSIISTDYINANSELVKISLPLILSFYTALYSTDFGPIARFLSNPSGYLKQLQCIFEEIDILRNDILYEPIEPDSVLLLFVAYQIYIGNKSPWKFIINNWPDPKQARNQNLFMAPKEVIKFISQNSNNFESRIQDNIDKLYSLLKHTHFLMNIINKSCRFIENIGLRKLSDNLGKKEQVNFPKHNIISLFSSLNYINIFSWSNLIYAKYILDTRSFSIQWYPLNNNYYEFEESSELEISLNYDNENKQIPTKVIYMRIGDFGFNENKKYSRFALPIPTGHIRCIIPIADMFNHHHLAPCSFPVIDRESGVLVIKNEIDIPKSSQIYISYGVLSSAESLYGYGFVSDTPYLGFFDTLTLNLEPDQDDPLYKIKMLVLNHCNIPTDHIFASFAYPKLTNIELLIKCVNIITSSDPITDLKKWDKQKYFSLRCKKKGANNIDECYTTIEDILGDILEPYKVRLDELNKYKSGIVIPPFWFSDWGNRVLLYCRTQIDLINLSIQRIRARQI